MREAGSVGGRIWTRTDDGAQQQQRKDMGGTAAQRGRDARRLVWLLFSLPARPGAGGGS